MADDPKYYIAMAKENLSKAQALASAGHHYDALQALAALATAQMGMAMTLADEAMIEGIDSWPSHDR